MVKLGVNIDHIATLREARRSKEPEPVFAALLCEPAGADSIVVHLREDRRHIKERDLYILKQVVKTKLNLEMSVNDEIVQIACKVKPDQATLVPEKRLELTTEGGLDVLAHFGKIKQAVKKLASNGIEVSLFIDPDKQQIKASKETGAVKVELHTGCYAEAKSQKLKEKYLQELTMAAKFAKGQGLAVSAGHGLDYSNAAEVAAISQIEELNIGYSIVCRAVMVGLERAVREMKLLINKQR